MKNMFKNIFRLTVLSRQLEAPRRLIHGRLQPFRSAFSRHSRLQPFRSAFSRHTRYISSGLAVIVPVLRVAVARSNATRSTIATC